MLEENLMIQDVPANTLRHPACMIDIETLGMGVDAVIVTIAAAIFDPIPESGHVDTYESIRADEGRFLNIAVDVQDNVRRGRHIDAGTVMWWLGQSKEAQQSLLDKQPVSLKIALNQLRGLIQGYPIRPGRIWAKSPDFDCRILGHAYQQFDEQPPWRYWETRCVRTLSELAFGEDVPHFDGGGPKHDALADVCSQIQLVQTAYHILGVTHA